jgi:hypothetical protein
MSLDTLHIEAGVPHYQEKLQKSMNRFFKKMAPESPVIRNNVSCLSSVVCRYVELELTPVLVLHPA